MQKGLTVVVKETVTLFFSRGILCESKSPAIGFVYKVNLFSDEIHRVLFIYIDRYAVNFIRKVSFFFPIKTDHKRHSAASAAFYSNAQAVVLRNSLGFPDVMYLFTGAG